MNYNTNKREYLISQGSTEYEADLILKLENYASILDKRFDDESEEIPFKELFAFIIEVQKDETITDKRIKSYSEYLHGAALPFYDKTIVEEDLETVEEFNYVISPVTGRQVKDWVTLVDNYEKGGIIINEFNDKLKTSGNLTKYFEDSEYRWALSIGVWHHFQIRKYRDKLKKMPFMSELIKLTKNK